MTGEITLRGRVLPVGGVKEKVLAAHRAGIRTVIMSSENDKDLEELPDNVREDIKFYLVDHMDEVLKLALLPDPEPAVITLSENGHMPEPRPLKEKKVQKEEKQEEKKEEKEEKQEKEVVKTVVVSRKGKRKTEKQ